MPDYDIDPGFERQLEQVLRAFSNEGVGTYDAVETTQIAVRGLPGATRQRSVLPAWVRPALVAALLVVSLVAAGIVGGFIRLPGLVIHPNPSFQPFSPAPLTFEPSFVPGSAAPSGLPSASQTPGTAPGSFPASGAPPSSTSETPTPSLETPAPSDSALPSVEPTIVPTTEPTTEPTAQPTAEPTTEPTPASVLAVDQGDLHQCALVEGGERYW